MHPDWIWDFMFILIRTERRRRFTIFVIALGVIFTFLYIMASSFDRYSYSLTTFSPQGKLVQIEYALHAVGEGKTALGIKAVNGVVIASEKKMPSPLVDSSSIEKVMTICNAGAVYAGMSPDYRILMKKARKVAQEYYRTYQDLIPTSQLVRSTAEVVQEYTQSGGVRPFGISVLVAGYDDLGPQLYQIDPSGSYWAWKAAAIGKYSANARTFLEKRYKPDMSLEDAIDIAILTLKESFDGQLSEQNCEIGIIGTDRKFRVLSSEEIKTYLEVQK